MSKPESNTIESKEESTPSARDNQIYNFEIKIKNGIHHTFPLIMQQSHVYSITNIFYIEKVETLSYLQKKLTKWFEKKVQPNSDESFKGMATSQIKDNEALGTCNGYLLIFIHKKIYGRVPVKIHRQTVHLENWEDYETIQRSLTAFLDMNTNEDKESKYNEIYLDWKNELKSEIANKGIYNLQLSQIERNLEHSSTKSQQPVKQSSLRASNHYSKTPFRKKTDGLKIMGDASSDIMHSKMYLDGSYQGKSIMSNDQDCALFRISDFERRLKQQEYEKFDRLIDSINDRIEEITDQIENKEYDNIINDPNTMVLDNSKYSIGGYVTPPDYNNNNVIWEKVFSISDSKDTYIPEDKIELEKELMEELDNKKYERDHLLKRKEEFQGSIFSSMIDRMNNCIKRNKRKIKVLKLTHEKFFQNHYDKILSYKQKIFNNGLTEEEKFNFKKCLEEYTNPNVHTQNTSNGNNNNETNTSSFQMKENYKKLNSVLFVDNHEIFSYEYLSAQGLIYRGTMINNAKEGYGILKDKKTGMVRIEGNFKNNKLHGKCIKVYNTYGDLNYEGDMVNDKKEGFGKEYHWSNGSLRYEGYFQNDEPHGKNVKIFNSNSEIEYSGEIFEGMKIEGTGKLYHKNGNLKYEGSFKGDKPYGQNAKYFDIQENLVYYGDVILGKRHGKGIEYHSNATIRYDGEWKNDFYHGNNVQIYYNSGKIEYEGDIIEGKKNGYGKMYHCNGRLHYKGGFRNDKPHGSNQQIYDCNGQLTYKCDMIEGSKEGYGKEYHTSTGRLKYKGEYNKDKPHGKYVYLYNCYGYTQYEGEQNEGRKHGFGKEYHWSTGKQIYKGEFDNNEPYGKNVKIYDKNGILQYEGEMYHGEKTDGIGKLEYFNGKLKFKGHFINNHPFGKNVEIFDINGGIIYKGEMADGKKIVGIGKEYHTDGKSLKFEGGYKNDKYDGQNCKLFDKDGNMAYDGDMQNGLKEGKGKLFHRNNILYYKGKFVDDLAESNYGKLFDKDGNLIYEGRISNGKKNGSGIEYHSNGKLKYKGNFVHDEPDGENLSIFGENGEFVYEGLVKDGVFVDGWGRQYHTSGKLKYEGNFLNGMPHGKKVKIFNWNGDLEYEGDLVDGKKDGSAIEYLNNLVIWEGEYKDGYKIIKSHTIQLF